MYKAVKMKNNDGCHVRKVSYEIRKYYNITKNIRNSIHSAALKVSPGR